MEETQTSAGAVSPESQPAAAVSEPQTNVGAVPETLPAAAEGVAAVATETPSQETAEAGKEGHQKTLEERVAELAEKRFNELQAKLTEKQQADAQAQPDYVEVDYPKLNAHLSRQIARETTIREEIALDPDNVDPALLNELMAIQNDREELVRRVRENESKKKAFLERMQEKETRNAFQRETQARIDDAGVLLKGQEKISDEVYEAGRQFFIKSCQGNPLLQRQFDETVMMKGPAAGVLFAWDYTKQHMGKKEEALIQQKEAAKEALPAGKTDSGQIVGNPQLDALKAQAMKSGNTEDLARYLQGKQAATQTR